MKRDWNAYRKSLQERFDEACAKQADTIDYASIILGSCDCSECESVALDTFKSARKPARRSRRLAFMLTAAAQQDRAEGHNA